MPNEADKIELRSEEVQEILGQIPNWVTRWGTTVIFFAIAGIIIVAGIIDYPEIVTAEVTLTTDKPPIPIYTKIGGNVAQLLVNEGEEIAQNDLIAIMQNTANEKDIDLISLQIDSFLGNPIVNQEINFSENPILGTLQNSYADFLTKYKEYHFFDIENANIASIQYVQSQIGQLQNVNSGLNAQWMSCQKELTAFQSNVNTDFSLFQKGIISQREYQTTENAYYQKKTNCDNIKLQISNNQVKLHELQMNAFGLSSNERATELDKFSALKDAANKLRSEIKIWEEKYLIIAPVDGIVSLNNIWAANQYIEQEQELLSIVRTDGTIKTIATLDNNNIGKIITGQKVILNFPAYNFMEYGYVVAKIDKIAPIPRDDKYTVEISIDNNQLMTTYDKELPFTQGMTGSAQVITEKQTILSRVLDKLKYIFEEKY